MFHRKHPVLREYGVKIRMGPRTVRTAVRFVSYTF